ncbi:MSHA biogenesis protein MshQ [Aeromonas sanarellii]|uniref:MSHA biogenesis protein MshQ n=1 Tax=Aeromonas sanarellii TaxID=633415 RepID=A0ABS4B5V0_9GAMM|nr:DUF6701 domain-containing protein [Aeromonas sanarellii]MBP0602862.1 MSHA biogenesis protein MshQ [Aeromonas sanarellii]
MILRFCGAMLLLLFGLPAHAVLNCNSVFPGPIQSHDAAGTLYMQSGARVESYKGLEVCFKRVTGYDYEMSPQACGTGKCQVTGVASLKQSRPTFPGSTDPASYTVANWTTPSVMLGTTPNYGKAASSSRWDLGNLTIDGSVAANGSGEVSFSDAYSSYVMKNVTLQNNGVMTLTAGKTYIIEGDLTLSSGTIRLVGLGITSLYIKGNFTVHNDARFQTGAGLNVYAVGNLLFTGNGQLEGRYYAEGDATFENQVVLRGQLSARHVNLKGDSRVIYDVASSTCKDIFTDPLTEGASMTPPPGVLVPPLGDLVCNKQGSGTSCTGHSGNSFGPGDHDFDDGTISNQAEIIATGVTARLYFNNLDLNNARLNLQNPPEHLFIYVKGDLSIAGQNQINAVVYVAGNVRMAGNATLEGALATGGNVDISGNGDYYFDQDAVDKVDLGGNTCGGGTGGAQIDHFELSHSGQALTCNPETVVIKACADASCSRLVAEQVSASLSLTPDTASNGWVGGNQLTFSGGSTTARLHNNTAGTVTMGVASSTPAFQHPTLCRAGGGVPSVAACTLSFADSGFVFDVLDTLANKPQDVVISAVKKDDATKQCVPGFAGVSKPVSFWGSYVTPNANAFGSQIRIDGNPVSTYAANVASPAGTVINVNFDSQGKATLKRVNYPDAGQMRLNARHDGSGDTAGLVMTGSDLFVSRPVGLCITPTQGACAAGDASCPVFKKTGEDFQLNIAAVAWQADDDEDLCSGNLATPNFALANIALGSELVAPKPGEEAVVGTASYDHSNAKGSNNLNSVGQSVNEVGVFRMTATPPAAGYFNYTIPPAASVPVGRFVPWDFNLVNSDVVPACEDITAPERDFTYMSQPFGIKLEVVARNMVGGQTQNYTGLFAKGGAYITTANNKDGNSLSSRLRSLQPLPWLNGQAAFTGTSEFVRLSDTQPDGPYKSLLFGLYMRDNDGDNSLIASPNFNDAVVGDCNGSGCNARLIDSVPMQAYFGRLLASTRQGVASAPLALPLQVQYFEGGGWKTNQADVCTQLSLANEGFDPTTSLDLTRKISFNNGSYEVTGQVPGATQPQSFRSTLTLSGLAAPASVATANKGEILFYFSAPNAAVRIPYRVDLSKQPSQPLWLSDPTTLQGEAIFGRDRGNDRIIYRREVMP